MADDLPLLKRLTYISVKLELYQDEQYLACATGFYCCVNDYACLVTNRHVVTGVHQETNIVSDAKGRVPNRMVIRHRTNARTLDTTRQEVNLYHDADCIEPSWVEHPVYGGKVDVVAIQFMNQPPGEFLLCYQDLDQLGTDMVVELTDRISVVGFPFGKSAGIDALWSTGHIASDPEVDVEKLPTFFISCHARPGQSGSPVRRVLNEGIAKSKSGTTWQHAGSSSIFLGVYSGRIHKDSDIGRVWNSACVRDVCLEARRLAGQAEPLQYSAENLAEYIRSYEFRLKQT